MDNPEHNLCRSWNAKQNQWSNRSLISRFIYDSEENSQEELEISPHKHSS